MRLQTLNLEHSNDPNSCGICQCANDDQLPSKSWILNRCGFVLTYLHFLNNRSVLTSLTMLSYFILKLGFNTAFRAGSVLGFALPGLGILILYLMLIAYAKYFEQDQWTIMMDSISGYGLGGSSVALFGRVGGGIYTKAADVGADLVGKVVHGIPEDSPRNPATIADNVGKLEKN